MNVKCPHCGTEYEAGKNQMYRYTKCSVCGKGFVAGATTSLQAGNSVAEPPPAPPPQEEAPPPGEEPRQRPKLALRKPPVEESMQDVLMEDKLRMAINVQPPVTKSAPGGAVSAAEERVRMYEAMRRKNARTKMLRNFVESAMLLMLLGALVGLSLWWMSHRNKVKAEEARISAEREAEMIRIAKERDKIDRERREKDRLEREAMLARERERRQKEQEAKEREERERRNNKELYNLCSMAIRENQFDLFVDSVTNDMCRTGGELCYLLPTPTTPPPLYHVTYETNGIRQVFRIDEKGNKDVVEAGEFDGMLKGVEYIVAKNGMVHFASTRKPPTTGLLPMAKEADPSETFFGALAPALMELKPTYDELTFDVFFTPRGSTKKIFVENLPFGCAWSQQNIRDAIDKATPRGSTGYFSAGSSRIKKFKRTVKVYGGSMIKQGLDGITYVPASPPPERYREVYSSTVPNCIYRSRTTVRYDNSRERWSTLYARAQQEEADEAAYYERLREKRQSSISAAQSAEERKRQAKIDGILRNGTLSYRIRKAKVPADKAH